MSVDILISTVREKTEEEKEKIRKEHERKTAEEERQKKEEIARKEKDSSERLLRKREKMIEDYRKEKEFELRMKILNEKKGIMEEATRFAVKEVFSLPEERKKQIFLQELEKIRNLFEKRDVFVFSPPGKKKEVEEVLEKAGIEAGVEEKEMDLKEGMLVKGKDFIARISLEDMIHGAVKEEKNYFFNLLFPQK